MMEMVMRQETGGVYLETKNMKYYAAIICSWVAVTSSFAAPDYRETTVSPVEFRNNLQDLWSNKDFKGLKKQLGEADAPWEGTLAQLYHRVRLLQRDGAQYEEAIRGLKIIQSSVYHDVEMVSPVFIDILNSRLRRLEKTQALFVKDGLTPEVRKNKFLLERQWKPNKSWDDGFWSILIQDIYLSEETGLIPIKRLEPSTEMFLGMSLEEVEKAFVDPEGSSQSRYAAAHWLADYFLSKDFEFFVKGVGKHYAVALFPILREKFWMKYGEAGLGFPRQELMRDKPLRHLSVDKFFLFVLAGAPEGQKNQARKIINEILTHKKHTSLREYGARLSNAMHLSAESKMNSVNDSRLANNQKLLKEMPSRRKEELIGKGEAKKYWVLIVFLLPVVGGYVWIKLKNKTNQ